VYTCVWSNRFVLFALLDLYFRVYSSSDDACTWYARYIGEMTDSRPALEYVTSFTVSVSIIKTGNVSAPPIRCCNGRFRCCMCSTVWDYMLVLDHDSSTVVHTIWLTHTDTARPCALHITDCSIVACRWRLRTLKAHYLIAYCVCNDIYTR
jgi:hypothetical protein